MGIYLTIKSEKKQVKDYSDNDFKDMTNLALQSIQYQKKSWLEFYKKHPDISLHEGWFMLVLVLKKGFKANKNFVNKNEKFIETIATMVAAHAIYASGTHSKKDIEEAVGAPLEDSFIKQSEEIFKQ